jgi:hypothetical protein
MDHRIRFKAFLCICVTIVVARPLAAPTVQAQAQSRRLIVQTDRASLRDRLKAFGYRKRGGIAKSKTDSNDDRFRSLPHFSSSFTVGGVTYPYTMVGHPPRSGHVSNIKTVIVPLRMRFAGFGPNQDFAIDFDPKVAVQNILDSPIYQDASFPNGFGQFNDEMQRATFFNKMDPQRNWHVRLAPPKVMHTVDIEVTPETGELLQLSDTDFIGNVLIDFMDAQARTIIQLAGLDPDEVPIFVTQNCTAEALGYHNAFAVATDNGKETLQTFIYTSWLEERLVGSLLADISTLNHESAELINDPFINNIVPTWMYPPPGDPRVICSDNPFLEVGDPQGNGPTFDDFPTVVIPLNGFNYHLQDLVMLPWFADEVPSSAQNGWYDFPATNQIHQPAVYCP